MAPRLQLHELFTGLTDHVYFQPPSNIQFAYPCIHYERNGSRQEHADNKPYRLVKRYQVTVMTHNPDSDLPDKVEELPLCKFDRFFTADNLNHYVFNLFF